MRLPVFLFLMLLWAGSVHAQTIDIGYVERGQASYYADNRGNAITQSGERYDGTALVASHAYFPMNTYLKVTNLDNGETVVVRVNDKLSNSQYALYLSKAAAEEIGCEGRIATDVKMEVVPKPASDFGFNQVIAPTQKAPIATPTVTQPMVGPSIAKQDDAMLPNPTAPTSRAATPPPATLKETFWKVGTYNMDGSAVKPLGYGVQVGSFGTIEDALEEGRKFQHLQFGNVYVQSGWDKGQKSFRVLIGSFMKEEETKDVIDFLNMRKYQAFPRKHLM